MVAPALERLRLLHGQDMTLVSREEWLAEGASRRVV